MFKKVVVSSYLASAVVDDVFAAPNNHSSLEILFAIYGYAFQIYADFSGYTDIAIGVALLLTGVGLVILALAVLGRHAWAPFGHREVVAPTTPA